MTEASTTHLVLIPSYNPGPKVLDTVRAARAQWTPVWVVVDGSTDGSGQFLVELAERHSSVRAVRLSRNFGKEAALTAGLDHAQGDAVL